MGPQRSKRVAAKKKHSWVRGADPLYLVILLRVVLGVADAVRRPKELAAL
jgi:hypothetical protein